MPSDITDTREIADLQREQRAIFGRIYARMIAAHDRRPPQERSEIELEHLMMQFAKKVPDRRRRKRLLRIAASNT